MFVVYLYNFTPPPPPPFRIAEQVHNGFALRKEFVDIVCILPPTRFQDSFEQAYHAR